MWRLLASASALAAVLWASGGTLDAQSTQIGASQPFLTAAAAPSAERAAAAGPMAPRTVVRERYVTANLQALADTGRVGLAVGGVRPRLLLNLFDDVALIAVLDAYDEGAGSSAWRGHVDGVAMSSVTLVTRGDLLAGSIASPRGVYAIRSIGDGVQVVTEVDQSKFLPELDPIQSPPGRSFVADQPQPEPQPDSGSRIDVLVLYTTAAKNTTGSTALMLNRIDLGITETNQSYASSGVSQVLRLVGTQEISGYSDNNDLAQDLDAVSNPATTVGATAASLRNSYGADLVVFITDPVAANGCGIAWFMSSVSSSFASNAFSVVENSCVSPNYSFGHEMGHNMGATHDWYVDGGTSPYTYIHGFVNTAAGNRFRTVMSYNNLCADQGFNCTRVLYWSNPAVTYNGTAMGIAGGTKTDCPSGQPSNTGCDADNHRVLNNTAYTVANFRQEVSTPTSPAVVTEHPKDQAVIAGGTATFTAAASGSPTPAVQWMVKPIGGVASYIPDSRNTTYAFTATVGADGNQYRAEFQNNLYSAVYTNWATLTVLPPFTDDPLQAGTTAVRVAHITELRARIAALRTKHGLPAYTFTDATLSAGTTPIKTAHITELREALAAVYTKAGGVAPTYTDSTLSAGSTAIKAVHITELRAAVVAIE